MCLGAPPNSVGNSIHSTTYDKVAVRDGEFSGWAQVRMPLGNINFHGLVLLWSSPG